MDNYTDNEIIWEFQKRLLSTYKSENLKCIAGLDKNYIIDGENVLKSFMDAMGKGQEIYQPENDEEKPKFDYNRVRYDLELISNEILHFTGLTCLYSQYLSNPLDHPIQSPNGETIYANHQDVPDKRFYMYATGAYEKLYNFWDRIGDLLASYFPENIKPKDVYFSQIEKFIPTELHEEENLKWLIDYKKNQFEKLNSLRIGIVHYENLDTTFVSEHLVHYMDRTQLKILIDKRSRIIPNLKSHIDLTLMGFVRTIRFMEFLNKDVLNQEQIKIKRKAVHNQEDTVQH